MSQQAKITSFFNKKAEQTPQPSTSNIKPKGYRVVVINRQGPTASTSTLASSVITTDERTGAIDQNYDPNSYNYESDATEVCEYDEEADDASNLKDTGSMLPNGSWNTDGLMVVDVEADDGLQMMMTKQEASSSSKRTKRKNQTVDLSEEAEQNGTTVNHFIRRTLRNKIQPSTSADHETKDTDKAMPPKKKQKTTEQKKTKTKRKPKTKATTTTITKKSKVSKPPLVITIADSPSPSRNSKNYNPNPLPTHSPLKLWTKSHQPRTTGDLIGGSHHSKQNIQTFKQWLSTWEDRFINSTVNESPNDDQTSFNVRDKCFYIHGPSGVGKTSLVYSVAADFGYKVLEFNGSSVRLTPSLVQKELNNALQSYCLNNNQSTTNQLALSKQQSTYHHQQPNQQQQHHQQQVKLSKSLILIDDLDGVIYENHRGGAFTESLWRALKPIIANARKPIVFTSSLRVNFLFSSNASDLSYFRSIRMAPIGRTELEQHLAWLVRSEQVNEGDEEKEGDKSNNVTKINDKVRLNCGDARGAINDAQFWAMHSHHQKTAKSVHAQQNEQSNSKEEVEWPHNLSAVNLATQALIYESLSVEDIYQTQLNRLCLVGNEFDSSYDRHLHDHRASLLFDSSESIVLNRVQTSAILSLDSHRLQVEGEGEELKNVQSTIDHLVHHHHHHHHQKQQNAPRFVINSSSSAAAFADVIVFYDSIRSTQPELVDALLEGQEYKEHNAEPEPEPAVNIFAQIRTNKQLSSFMRTYSRQNRLN